MKTLIFISLAFISWIPLHGQVVVGGFPIGYTRDVEGKVVLKDGEILTGKITLPGSFDKKLKVNNKDVDASKISYLEANHPKHENTYRFVYTTLMRYKNNGDLKIWQKEEKGWIALAQNGPKAGLYNFAPKYTMNADGDLLMQLQYLSAFPVFGLKSNEDHAIMVSLSSTDSGLEIGTRSFFIKSCEKFFTDNAALVQKIKNKELGIGDLRTIFQIYNEE